MEESERKEVEEALRTLNNFNVLNGTNKGYLVETKSGILGRTYHSDPLVNGKQRVYTLKGNMLCDPGKLKLKGFID